MPRAKKVVNEEVVKEPITLSVEETGNNDVEVVSCEG